MAVPEGSASRVQSEKQHQQCSDDTLVSLRKLIQERKDTSPTDGHCSDETRNSLTKLPQKRKDGAPAGAQVIKKSKTVCVCPVKEFEIDQRSNVEETGRVTTADQQGMIAHLKSKFPNQKGKSKVAHRKGQESSVSSVLHEEEWKYWRTKEPSLSPSPVDKEIPKQFGEYLKEAAAGDSVYSDEAVPLAHTYGERGKQLERGKVKCEMVFNLSQKVEPEDETYKMPKFDQLLKEPDGVCKKLQDILKLKLKEKDNSDQQY